MKPALTLMFTVLVLAGCAIAPRPATVVEEPESTPAVTAAPVAEEPAAPVETAGQSNAVRKAESYLSFTSFSRTGLIAQLEFEGFSAEDSAYAADAVGADWSAQAAAKALDYLKISAFSHSGLVDQLVFDGFTPDEAEFGVVSAGL